MNINYNFEWDFKKANLNWEKHRVSFEEAATVFLDPIAISLFDADHNDNENRWATMGISKKGRLLIVCHTFKEKNDETVNIRIFSGRKANKREIDAYGEKY